MGIKISVFIYFHCIVCRQGVCPFCVVLVGSDVLVSSSVQAFSQSSCQTQNIRFALIPIGECTPTSRYSDNGLY